MKTLVLLSALVSVAIAAPALQEDGLEKTHHVSDSHIPAHQRIPEPVRREKKSTLEQSTSTALNSGSSHFEHHNEASTSLTGRNTLKKPLIVKKKFGYKLYRDSEEEKAHADSNETCGRQVKVKLCDEDGKFKEMLRSSTHDMSNVHSSEEDMKLSIKMAKEAVENLQRDLMQMEHRNTAMKMAHDTESDTDLHKDIEVARQALDHIHTNFENVDTMRLHATALKDSEAIHDVHITVAKSEEERMAQWKEAMDNIQKNYEIARNIEDSFKAADEEADLFHLDTSESASTSPDHKLEEDIASHIAWSENHHMRNAEIPHLNVQSLDHAREEQHTEDDMNPSASEVMEMKTVNIENEHTLKSENQKHHEHEKNAEIKSMEMIEDIQEHHDQHARNSESEHDMLMPMNTIQQQHSLINKEAEDIAVSPKVEENNHIEFKTSENVAETHMAPSTNSDIVLKSHVTDEAPRSTLNTEIQHEQLLKETDNITGLNIKSVEHVEEDKKMNEEAVLIDKAAVKDDMDKHHSKTVEIKPENTTPTPVMHIGDQATKEPESNVQEIHLQKYQNIAEQNENFMKAADTLLDHNLHKIDYNESEPLKTFEEMRLAEDHLHHHHLTAMKQADHLRRHHNVMKAAENHMHRFENGQTNGHWANEHRFVPSMKSSDDFKKDFHGIESMRNSHHTEHGFIPSNIGVTHDIEMSENTHQHAHVPARHHHNMMSHSKMHDLNSMAAGMPSNFHPSMREALDGLGSEHTYRWMPSHESARNAYGAGLSSLPGSYGSSGGAVGVFPNANTGACGIPLLLSCSPSVVSGSLAKAHASGSYSSPSYRTEDDFTFHNKRDIKTTSDIKSANLLRTPSILKQKTGTIAENKI